MLPFRKTARRTHPIAHARALASFLSYDVIRLQQDGLWNRKPEHVGSLQIDDQLELRRSLNRKLGRLCAAKYAVDIHGSALDSIESSRAVGEQPTTVCKEALLIDGRQAVTLRELDDLPRLTMKHRV